MGPNPEDRQDRATDAPKHSPANEPEALAHFFVPLPEPVSLPDGYTHVASFEPPLDVHAWLSDPDHSHDGPPVVPPLYSVMLRFHQVPLTASELTRDLDFLMSVAGQILPDGAMPKKRAERGGSLEPDGLVMTVVELVVKADESDAATTAARFDFGLDVIRQVQRAYAALIGHWTVLVTHELLPLAIPLAVQAADESWAVSMYVVNETAVRRAIPPTSTLDPDQVSRIADLATSLGNGHPVALHRELRREASVNLWRLGNTRAAVVFAHTSGEVLFDSLLAHLLWEEGEDPQDSAGSIFHRVWLAHRIRTQYHNRLGGSWSAGTVQDWLRDCAGPRHRVVHGGYEPDHEEARVALEATDRLVEFVAKRMQDPKVVERYPRTVIAVRGPRASDGPYGKRLFALLNSPAEPDWLNMFGRWKFFLDARLRDLAGLPRPDGLRAISSTLVVEGNGDYAWYAHDPDNGLVRRSAAPSGISAEELIAKLPAEAAGERTSLVHWAPPGAPLEPDWIAEYKVLPGLEVTLGYPRNLP